MFLENTSLIWVNKENSQDYNYKIEPSLNDSCVIVWEKGMYSVFSQITFKFKKESHNTAARHAIIRKVSNSPRMVQQKPIYVAENRTQDVTETSTLIAFPMVEEGDKICVIVAPLNQVYVSPVDNMLTLFKMVAVR